MDYSVKISCNKLKGEIKLPASKSISNRVLVMNALAKSDMPVENVAKCDDTDAVVEALASVSNIKNIGAAGTAMRFLTAYFSMLDHSDVILDGTQRMRQRPIKVLVDALRKCGADIEYCDKEGYPPIRIKGRKLNASSIELPGDISSQYISALLMIAPGMEPGLDIVLKGKVISLPYIDMTILLMRKFGIKVNMSDNVISVSPGVYSPVKFKVESDWSAASYWYELQALLPGSGIILYGLAENSVQGDSMVARYFEHFGVKTSYCDGNVILSSEPCFTKPGFVEINLVNQPDLAQTIIVTACLKEIHFKITGLSTLKIKETDRIEALKSQLAKLGYVIDTGDDYSMSWTGKRCAKEQFPSISTFDDHRMAMAFAPASIFFPGIVIEDIDVVSKSYPAYWDHLRNVGFELIPV